MCIAITTTCYYNSNLACADARRSAAQPQTRGAMQPGPSGFDFSDSAPHPPPRRGLPPPPENKIFCPLRYTPARYTTVTRCLAGEKIVVRTLKNDILLSFLSDRAYVSTSQNINCWDLVLNPTHEILWSRSECFSLRGGSESRAPGLPCIFCVFSSSRPLPLTPLGRALNEKSKPLRPAQATRRVIRTRAFARAKAAPQRRYRAVVRQER